MRETGNAGPEQESGRKAGQGAKRDPGRVTERISERNGGMVKASFMCSAALRDRLEDACGAFRGMYTADEVMASVLDAGLEKYGF